MLKALQQVLRHTPETFTAYETQLIDNMQSCRGRKATPAQKQCIVRYWKAYCS